MRSKRKKKEPTAIPAIAPGESSLPGSKMRFSGGGVGITSTVFDFDVVNSCVRVSVASRELVRDMVFLDFDLVSFIEKLKVLLTDLVSGLPALNLH
jgi:hypothetical protein